MDESIRNLLFDKYRGIVEEYVKYASIPSQDAVGHLIDEDDVLQECYIELLKLLEHGSINFDRDPAEIAKYIKRRTRWRINKVIGKAVSQSKYNARVYSNPLLSADDTFEDMGIEDMDSGELCIEEAYVRNLLLDQGFELLNTLNFGYITKEILFNNKSYREVGRIYRKNKDTVKKRHKENLRELRKIGQKHDGLE